MPGQTTWTDVAGKMWRPEDMSPSHRANAVAFAERNALRLYQAHLMNEAMNLPDDGWAMTAMDQIFDEAEDATPEKALTWLRKIPVMVRLYELVGEDRANATIAAGRLRDDDSPLHVGWWEE